MKGGEIMDDLIESFSVEDKFILARLESIEKKFDRVLIFISGIAASMDSNVQNAIADLEKQQKEIHGG
jgi:hypothetical protein